MTLHEIKDRLTALTDGNAELTSARNELEKQGMNPVKVLATMEMLNELQTRMKTEVLHFLYEKKDGSTRHAYGTRAGDIIGRHSAGTSSQKNTNHTPAPGTFPYFDIERKAWRCFRVDGINYIMREYEI